MNPLLPDSNFLKDRMTVEQRIADLEKKLNNQDKRLDKVEKQGKANAELSLATERTASENQAADRIVLFTEGTFKSKVEKANADFLQHKEEREKKLDKKDHEEKEVKEAKKEEDTEMKAEDTGSNGADKKFRQWGTELFVLIRQEIKDTVRRLKEAGRSPSWRSIHSSSISWNRIGWSSMHSRTPRHPPRLRRRRKLLGLPSPGVTPCTSSARMRQHKHGRSCSSTWPWCTRERSFAYRRTEHRRRVANWRNR